MFFFLLHRYEVVGYDNKIDTWFSNAVGRPCYLLRSSSKICTLLNKSKNTSICRDIKTRLNFVNEAQLLLISEESVSDLNHRLNSSTLHNKYYYWKNMLFIHWTLRLCMIFLKAVKEGPVGLLRQVDAMRFRPNLVISGGGPYAEDRWSGLKIGKNHFMVSSIFLQPKIANCQTSDLTFVHFICNTFLMWQHYLFLTEFMSKYRFAHYCCCMS